MVKNTFLYLNEIQHRQTRTEQVWGCTSSPFGSTNINKWHLFYFIYLKFVIRLFQIPRSECTTDHHHPTRTLTRSRLLSGGAGEVEGLGSVGFQELIDIRRTEASLLTNQEAAKGSHGHICPVHLQVHQQLLEHQQRLRQQREVIPSGSWGQSQQYLQSKTQWMMLTTQ